MKLHVVKTGSAGNCYILEGSTSALILEAGVRFLEVKKAIGFSFNILNKISGVLISHEHKDHCEYLDQYSLSGLKCYVNYPVLNEHFKRQYPIKKKFCIGEFQVMAFPLIHDVECYGFQIDHPECGRLIFMTDTQYSPFVFHNVTNWLVECNYSSEIIDENVQNGLVNEYLAYRIKRDHLSLENLEEILKSNDLSSTRNIILIHGSEMNGYMEGFEKKIIQRTGKPVSVAKNNLKLNL